MHGSMEVRPPQNGLCVMRNIDSLVHSRDNHPVHSVVYSVLYPEYRSIFMIVVNVVHDM